MHRYRTGRSPQVFISYSHYDRQFAEDLSNSLTRDGVTVWFDDWRIHIGDSIVRKIQDGISSSDFFIIVLSHSSTESRWVNQELSSATIRNIEAGGGVVLPVLIDKCEIPIFLSDKKYADFTTDPPSAYKKLLATIDQRFNKKIYHRESILDTRLAIVHTSTTNKKGFPVLKFTIANRSNRSQVINRLEYDIVEYHPFMGIPQTRLLKPIDIWDIELHSE